MRRGKAEKKLFEIYPQIDKSNIIFFNLVTSTYSCGDYVSGNSKKFLSGLNSTTGFKVRL